MLTLKFNGGGIHLVNIKFDRDTKHFELQSEKTNMRWRRLPYSLGLFDSDAEAAVMERLDDNQFKREIINKMMREGYAFEGEENG